MRRGWPASVDRARRARAGLPALRDGPDRAAPRGAIPERRPRARPRRAAVDDRHPRLPRRRPADHSCSTRRHEMDPVRLFSIASLVSLPTVMIGGYALLSRLVVGGVLSPFQETYFRAGHAHAGVLVVLSLVYLIYLERTTLPVSVKWMACGVLAVGVLAQSGGFFLHMLVGAPGEA